MATIDQLKQALIKADAAGDYESASVLAEQIKRQQQPSQGVPLSPGEKVPAPKEDVGAWQHWLDFNSAFNKLAIEYGPGLFTTVGATIKGLADATINSDAKYGSKGFADYAQKSTEKTNEALLKNISPKLNDNSQAIYDYLSEKAGDVMMGMMSNPHYVNEIGTHYLGEATKKILDKSPEVYQVAKDTGSKVVQQVKNKMTKPQPTPEELAQTTKRQQAAANLPKPIQLTKGQATNAFEEQQFEQTAGKTIAGDELRKNAEIQNMKLQSNLDALIHDVEAVTTEPAATGETVREAISQHKKNEAQKVQEAYTKAMESEEGNSPVALNDTINYLNQNKTIATDIPVLKIMSQKAIDYGVAIKDAEGNLIPLETTLNKAEDFRKSITSNTQQSDNRDIYHASQLKDNFTIDTENAGGDLYANARSKYTEFKNKFEKQQIIKDILSNKTNSNDKLIATENIFRKSILNGTAQDIANLKKTLLYAGEEGKKAWQNLQGTLLRHIKEEATKNVARDTAGNPIFSASRINQIVKDLEHGGRLEILLGKDGADVVRTINDVAKHVLVSPPGTVNYSNTAPILAAMLDVGASAFSGVPAPIASVGRYVWQSIKDKKLQARIQKSLNFSPKVESTYKKPSFGIKETPPEAQRTKPTKEEVKAKVEAKKAEKEGKKKVVTPENEATTLYKEVKDNKNLDAYKSLMVDEGGAKTKGERNKSHNWFDVPVEDEFGQTVATKRIAGQRDITEAFTADKASIDRFMKGKATVEDLKAIKHDLNTFELNSNLRDEASILRANKSNESVELSDGSIYDPFSKMTYSKKEWQDLMDEAMFSKSPAEQSRLEEWHKDSAPETKNADGTPKVFYHGTGADFSEFKNGVINWTTPDINLAEEYSYIQRANGRTDIRKSGQSVMPVFVKVKNPLEIRSPLITRTAKDFIYEVMNSDDVLPILRKMPKEELDALLKDIEKLDDTRNVELYNLWDNNTELIGIFKKFGFDSIKTQESGSTTIGVFNPNQIKSVFNKGTFSESNPNILMSKDKAFNSVLKDAIDSMPNKMNTEAFKSYLKGKGVKDDEINFSGIKDILDKQTVTKAEVLANYAEPNLQKATKGYDSLIDKLYNQKKNTLKAFKNAKQEWLKENPQYADLAPSESGDIFAKTELGKKLYDEYNYASEHYSEAVKSPEGDTKFENYKTPNVGTNYREVLTTVPKINEYDRQIQAIDKRMSELVQLSGGEGKEILDAYKPEWKDLFARKKQVVNEKYATKNDTAQTFHSSHWDEPNVLYHTRLQDTTIGKEKTLLVEEIQSDWHQEGRKKGYKGKDAPKDISINDFQEVSDGVYMYENIFIILGKDNKSWEIVRNGNVLDTFMKQENAVAGVKELLQNESRLQVPQAPYSKTWHEKAMKDIIDEAVNNGYDRVAWTVGKTQADRYSLAKSIDRIDARLNNDGTYYLRWFPKESNSHIERGATYGSVQKEKLADIVGKDMANKIIKDTDASELKEIDKKIYNLIAIEPRTPEIQKQIDALRDRWYHLSDMQDTGKTYSGLDLEVGGEGMKGFYDKILPDFTNKYIKKYGSKVEKKTLSNGDEVWSFEVTDKMKEDISGKGQSLFSQFKTKNAITKQEAQTIAQNLLGKHYAKHADTFEIVQSVEDLPQNIKDALYSVEAYHGTPHNVDRFSTKYIGTGEGAQAYGYGMYFADSKEVARHYQKTLPSYNGKAMRDFEDWQQSVLYRISQDGYDNAKAFYEKQAEVQKEHFGEVLKLTKRDLDFTNQINPKDIKGNLYKVELKPKEDEYLQWDKPLSEQSPQVRKALKQALGKARYNDTDTGGYVYKHILQGGFADDKGISKSGQGASDYLHSLGIRGIKYLDNTSRGKGEGNYNYVIFKDEDVGKPEILKSGGKARGIFDPKSGKAYIIADAMKANEVEGVILHELLHKNINKEVKAGKSRAEAIMGSRYESVVKRLDNLYKMGDKQVKDAFQKVTDANTPAQHRIEEVMTYLLENITNESKPLLIKWKDDVIAAIKAFIAKTALQLGMKAETVMSKLDSKDIANILRSEAIKNESMLKNIKR